MRKKATERLAETRKRQAQESDEYDEETTTPEKGRKDKTWSAKVSS